MKRERWAFLVLGICIFIMSACSNVFYPQSDALEKIKMGMTPQEVTKLLGKPDYRRISYDLEEWEYQKLRSVLDSKPTTVIVRFENERLVYMDSFPTHQQTSTSIVFPTPMTGSVPSHSLVEPHFEAFYNQVKAQPFKDEQIELIRTGVKGNRFTCHECACMMSIFTFDDDKLEVLRIFSKHLIDRENYKEIINRLDYLSSKEKAEKILRIDNNQ